MTDRRHEELIKKTIVLAKTAMGNTSPNPLVGAIIVKNGEVIALGYHKKAGMPHAEINAINNARDLKGASLYVNMEPCSHLGRTPPCVDAIIRSGITRVYVGMLDPNPIVAGKGVDKLKSHGLKVTTGILQKECYRLNEFYIKYITRGLPFVILKSAMTLDGKTATSSGDSKWISNDKSRKFVHKLRSEVDAIMVGSGTLLKDDPLLTVRMGRKANPSPLRVIIDRALRINERANVLKNTDVAKTIIFHGASAKAKKVQKLTEKGVQLVKVHEKDGALNLREVLKRLAKEEITSVLVEGGAALHSSFINNSLADKMYLFLAPKLMLCGRSKPVFDGREISGKNKGSSGKDLIKDLRSVSINQVRRFDDDIMVEFYF